MILYLFMFKTGKIKTYTLTFIWYKTVCRAYFILFFACIVEHTAFERYTLLFT